MVYNFFDKKSSSGAIKAEPDYQLANELHRQITRKFTRRKSARRKVCSYFTDNVWGAYLADMQSLSMGYSKYAWVVPLKDKRRISIINAFQKII